jgi:hypothetical protein
MATLQEIVDTTVSLIGNEDDKIKTEVEIHIHNLRAKYLKQHLDKNGYADWMTQSAVVSLELDTYSPLCNGLSCKVNKSSEPIPTPIRGQMIKVMTIGGTTIQYTTLEKFNIQKHERYTSSAMRYFMMNNHIIIPNNQLLKSVLISGVFENPSDLYVFENCSNCGINNTDYPIHIDYIPIIQQEIMNMYIRQQDERTNEV